jgi:hypothetical protein
MKHPPYAARREDSSWHDDAACVIPFRSGSQSQHLLMRVLEGVAKISIALAGTPNFNKIPWVTKTSEIEWAKVRPKNLARPGSS